MSRCLNLLSPAGLVFVLVLVAAAPAAAQRQTLEVTKLAEGVYAALYSEMIDDPVQSNALIVIGDDGVAVVDSHYTPAAARATIAEIRRLTPLPVRYVITTHWHDDHVFGNQAYREAYPGVVFVAQKAAREAMVGGSANHAATLIKSYADAIASTEAALASGRDAEGKALEADARADATVMLPIYREYLEQFQKVSVVVPSLTFDRELTLHLGKREVRAMSLGTGNTPGDAVIFLPEEKIAAVGDLVVHPVPFIYGGFPASWVGVLGAVKALEPAMIVPGHGPVMRDFVYLDRVSALMQEMAAQASAAVARGLTLEEARKTFDLDKFKAVFEVDGNESRAGTFEASIVRSGMAAAYREARAAAERGRGLGLP